MSQFVVDADWLHWHQSPSVPDFKVPEGAVDAHCHVFGPGDQFPFAPQRKYTPCDASKDQLWACATSYSDAASRYPTKHGPGSAPPRFWQTAPHLRSCQPGQPLRCAPGS